MVASVRPRPTTHRAWLSFGLAYLVACTVSSAAGWSGRSGSAPSSRSAATTARRPDAQATESGCCPVVGCGVLMACFESAAARLCTTRAAITES